MTRRGGFLRVGRVNRTPGSVSQRRLTSRRASRNRGGNATVRHFHPRATRARKTRFSREKENAVHAIDESRFLFPRMLRLLAYDCSGGWCALEFKDDGEGTTLKRRFCSSFEGTSLRFVVRVVEMLAIFVFRWIRSLNFARSFSFRVLHVRKFSKNSPNTLHWLACELRETIVRRALAEMFVTGLSPLSVGPQESPRTWDSASADVCPCITDISVRSIRRYKGRTVFFPSAIPGMARRWQTLCKALQPIFLPLFCL